MDYKEVGRKEGLYPITALSRPDLTFDGFFTKEQEESLTDDDMEYIARKMADAYMEVYWIDLKIIASGVLDDKKKEATK